MDVKKEIENQRELTRVYGQDAVDKPAGAVPGSEYKLMPKQITEEMAKAFWEEYSKSRTDSLLTRCYKAMYAAAPSHSQQSADTVTDGFKIIPDLPHGFNHCAYNRQTGEWLYINHANTWQLFQGPLTDRCPSHESEQL